MNTLFLVLIILCAFNQAIGIDGGSWFEGKQSPKKEVFNAELDGTAKVIVDLKG